jgi:hypothetical protein
MTLFVVVKDEYGSEHTIDFYPLTAPKFHISPDHKGGQLSLLSHDEG